jgi:hypothetical protein
MCKDQQKGNAATATRFLGESFGANRKTPNRGGDCLHPRSSERSRPPLKRCSRTEPRFRSRQSHARIAVTRRTIRLESNAVVRDPQA